MDRREPNDSALAIVLPLAGRSGKKIIYFSSYDGSFLAVSYAYASQFYDASSFYHKALVYKDFFVK